MDLLISFGSFVIKILLVLILGRILLALSPLPHELFHAFAIKIFGGEIKKIEMTFFDLEISLKTFKVFRIGDGKIQYDLPKSRENGRIIDFLIGLSGGLGTGLLLLGVGLLFLLRTEYPWFIPVSFFYAGVNSIIYGFLEAMNKVD